MNPIIRQIAEEFKAQLQQLYGQELAALVLFGSHARNEANADSDVDFAVVLRANDTTSTSEIFKISNISCDIGSKYGHLVSYIGMPEQKYQHSSFGIYQEIRKDGIVI